MSATLTITIGLPGSGKTTWARQQAGSVRVNRDDLRQMMFGLDVLTPEQEEVITIAQKSAVTSLLLMGHNVIVDDTNLHPKSVEQWQSLAILCCGGRLTIKDFRHVPVALCKERVAYRASQGGRDVPEWVIDKMNERIK